MSFIISKNYGKLHLNDLGGYESRNSSTYWCIQKADEIYNFKDFNDIKIYTGDFEEVETQYTYSKCDSYTNLIPDFNFHSWPEAGINDYESFVKDIVLAGLSPYEINKVGWIGSISTNFRRKQMLEMSTKNKDIFDIISMSWIRNVNSKGTTILNSTNYLSTPELVKKYSILIDIEGSGYSGRLKHLLWSHRPVLLVDRPHKEFFFEYLKEWEHYIPVKRDLSDLVEKAKWCLDNYDKGLQIAENAYQFSKKYLTRDACYEQWNKVISKHIV